MQTVKLWLCLDPSEKVGLWFREEADALKHKFHVLYPIEIPAAVYLGLPLPGSKVVRAPNDGELIE